MIIRLRLERLADERTECPLCGFDSHRHVVYACTTGDTIKLVTFDGCGRCLNDLRETR